MEWTRDPYMISTDREKINLPYVHHFLTHSYWAQQIPLDTVRRSVEGSLCFGIYHGAAQIGFARVITDGATFAYLADVFVEESYRGQGLGKWLVGVILGHPQLQGLRRFLLATRDAHGLYSGFGFSPLTHTERWMHLHHPDLYRKASLTEAGTPG
ncbi:MAG: GNAT family N-acetyltransferase [Flavisolibacter sp.]